MSTGVIQAVGKGGEAMGWRRGGGCDAGRGVSCPPGSFNVHLAQLCHLDILAFNCR